MVSTAHLLVMVTSPKEQKSPTITNRLQKKLKAYFNMVTFSVYTVQNVEIISTMNARASNRLAVNPSKQHALISAVIFSSTVLINKLHEKLLSG